MLYNVSTITSKLNHLRPWLNNKLTRIQYFNQFIPHLNHTCDEVIIFVAKNDNLSLAQASDHLIGIILILTQIHITTSLNIKVMGLPGILEGLDLTEDELFSCMRLLDRLITNLRMINASIVAKDIVVFKDH